MATKTRQAYPSPDPLSLEREGTPFFRPELLFLTQMPAVVDPREVASVLAMGLGLSLLATIYPSWRAARIDPVEALRHG